MEKGFKQSMEAYKEKTLLSKKKLHYLSTKKAIKSLG